MKAGDCYGLFPKLIERIACAQRNKGNILTELIQDATPIIKKYAFLLKYEDVQTDLQLDFIELICNLKTDSFSPKEDQYVLSYIEKTIRSAYIKRSKEKARENHCGLLENLTSGQKQFAEKTAATYDRYNELDIPQLRQMLTPCQFKAIYSLYYMDLSVKETGQALGISRQAVNQTKSKALAKLRQAWLYTSFQEGQCTWYCAGRSREIAGKKLTFSRTTNLHAKYWMDVVTNCTESDTPEINSIAVFKGGPDGLGHVAFVYGTQGPVSDPDIYFSDSNTSRDNKKTYIWEKSSFEKMLGTGNFLGYLVIWFFNVSYGSRSG